MSLVPTNLFMNWTGTQVSYGTTPTVVVIPEVTSVEVDRGGAMKRWSADADIFAKAIGMREKTRKIKIMGGAVNKLAQIPENTPCTVTSILNDFYNGAAVGGGAVQVTATNAILVNNPFKGSHNEFGQGDVEFECFAADGTTDPLTITAV